MKKIYAYLLMIMILIMTGVAFAYTPVHLNQHVIQTNLSAKNIPSKLLLREDTPDIQTREITEEKVEEEVVDQPKVSTSTEQESVLEVIPPEQESVPEVIPPEQNSVSLEHAVGSMSSYGPDCVGCNGYLANGFNGMSSIYYEDPTYGVVRIVAADRKYPFGTIIKVTGSKWGDFNAIVMDRGGNIGFGRRFLFDLLWASEAEAANAGTSYDTSFDVLRLGY